MCTAVSGENPFSLILCPWPTTCDGEPKLYKKWPNFLGQVMLLGSLIMRTSALILVFVG